jgi:peroxiredoxin
MPFLSETDEGPIEELKKIYEWTKNRNIDFYALSSASLEPVKEFKKKHNLSFDIHAADQKMLMTMARYNPTFYLFKGSTVLDKFSGFNMPTISRLEEITGI